MLNRKTYTFVPQLMSRPPLTFSISKRERAALGRMRRRGDRRQRKLAALVLLLANGKGYRQAAARTGVSSRTAVAVVGRFRFDGIKGLAKAGPPPGRRSKMDSAEVRRFLVGWLAGNGKAVAEQVVQELRRRFHINLSPASLPYWLRKWRLKLAHKTPQPRRVPPVTFSPASHRFINKELAEVARKLKDERNLEWAEKRWLKIKQDQLLMLSFLKEGGYSQLALAEHFARSLNAINAWQKAFRAAGGGMPGIKKVLTLDIV